MSRIGYNRLDAALYELANKAPEVAVDKGDEVKREATAKTLYALGNRKEVA